LLPGIWAATDGAVLAGEDSLAGAVRETQEELGLAFESSRPKLVARHVRSDRITDVWEVSAHALDAAAVECGPEVAEAKWVTSSELFAMVDAKIFYDYGESYFAALHIAP